MRPKVVHLIDDTKLGGVNLALESLAASTLQQSFSFKLLYRQFNSCSFQRYQADVIVVHAAASWRKLPAFIALKLANFGKPILYQEHHYSREFARHCVLAPRRFTLMLKLTYKLMHKVLLVSESQRDWLTEQAVTPADKMVLVGQGKELGAFTALPSTAYVPSPTKPLKLLAYGRLSKQKGFDLLIKAMAKLPAEKVQLAIAGEGEQQAELVKLANGLSHVEFVGEVQDVANFLAAGDIVIIPSRWEPFGLTCIEAVAAGKAVIVANLDGLANQTSALKSCSLKGPQAFKLLNELSVAGIEIALKQVIEGERLHVSDAHRASCEAVWLSVLNNWQQLLTLITAKR